MRNFCLSHEGNATQILEMICEGKGLPIINLFSDMISVPPLTYARHAVAKAMINTIDDFNVLSFAEQLVTWHLDDKLPEEIVDYLPISGVNSIFSSIVLANRTMLPIAMPNLGYAMIRNWCCCLKNKIIELEINSVGHFLFEPKKAHGAGLIMMNYPHYPSGAVAEKKWLTEVCAYAEKHNIRIFNDASYAGLTYVKEACTLAEVAVSFPSLSWAEAFSAANLIGGEWNIGTLVGSIDFISDVKAIKNCFGADQASKALAIGVSAALQNERSRKEIDYNSNQQHKNVMLLWHTLHDAGMRACGQPASGFCVMYRLPRLAFKKPISTASAFNQMMAEETGVIGIPCGEKHIAYSAAAVNVEAVKGILTEAFEKADVLYEY